MANNADWPGPMLDHETILPHRKFCMAIYHFTLRLPADEYVRYYQGQAREVVVDTVEGVTLRFPAAKLVRFVTRDGVYGDFRLQCDANNRFLKLESLGSSSPPGRDR